MGRIIIPQCIQNNFSYHKQWFLSGGNFAYPGNSIIYFLCLNCATGDILSTSAQKGPYNDTTDDLTKNWKIPHISSQIDLNVDIYNLNKKSTELLQICKDVSGIASISRISKVSSAQKPLFSEKPILFYYIMCIRIRHFATILNTNHKSTSDF